MGARNGVSKARFRGGRSALRYFLPSGFAACLRRVMLRFSAAAKRSSRADLDGLGGFVLILAVDLGEHGATLDAVGKHHDGRSGA